jgi:hypothetical protein
MKRFLLTLSLLLTAAMAVMASEHDVTINRGEGLYEDGTGVYYCVKDGVMMTFTDGLDNENFLVERRNKIFEVRSANYIIKKIIFHCVDNTTEDDLEPFYWGPTTISAVNNFTFPGELGTYSVTNNGYDGVWEGRTAAIQFITAEGKPVRFGSVEIIYEKLDGDIFDLVTHNDQIVEGKTYIIVSQYYDKVMEFKKSDDATFPATDIVQWMNPEKTKVKVDGNACLFKMEGVKDTLSTPQKAAWLNTQNGYIRSQNYNLITRTTPNDYCRAHMYISVNESNLLLKFNDMSSGNDFFTVRYDYDNPGFKMLNYNDDTQQRVWLYKLAESYHVYTICDPEEGGSINITSGVVDGVSQQYELVTFNIVTNDGYTFKGVQATSDAGGVVDPINVTQTTNPDGSVTYSLVMPAADVTIKAAFEAGVPSSVQDINAQAAVEAVEYYNLSGIKSAHPHDGINIVVTRYSDGSASFQKIYR